MIKSGTKRCIGLVSDGKSGHSMALSGTLWQPILHRSIVAIYRFIEFANNRMAKPAFIKLFQTTKQLGSEEV